MNLLLRIIITSISAIVAAYILPGVHLEDFSTAIILAVVLALLNSILKPILVILTIPITIFTFGLFLLVINAAMIMLAGHFISGFEVVNFWWALLFSIILSIISSLLGIGSTRQNRNRQ
jgi:putative membrane protein